MPEKLSFSDYYDVLSEGPSPWIINVTDVESERDTACMHAHTDWCECAGTLSSSLILFVSGLSVHDVFC